MKHSIISNDKNYENINSGYFISLSSLKLLLNKLKGIIKSTVKTSQHFYSVNYHTITKNIPKMRSVVETQKEK